MSDWVDCSGTVAAGRRAGAARKGDALKWGDVLDFAVRFVVHYGDVEEADVAGMWGLFVAGGLG